MPQVSHAAPAPTAATVLQQGQSRHRLPLLCFTQGGSRLANNLPLILLLTLAPLHADHLLQLRESKSSERLGEDVRELPTSFDELDDDLPSIDTVPEEVELHVDVFALVVQNRILREGDGGLVVHH